MDEEQVMEQVTSKADCAAEFEELIRGRCRQPFQQRVQKILDGRLRTLRQENEALRRQAQERLGFENDCVARLAREAEDIRRVYDGFDWQKEMRDPAFGRLIAAGVDGRTAYEVVHSREILAQAMRYGAKRAAEQCSRAVASAAGAHQITSLQCPGVKRGSSRSLAVADGVLYFHGSGGVYAFDGSMPRLVSACFGDERYESAVGGAAEGHYWLSARRSGGDHLFVYDTARGLWHRQDGLRVKQFAVSGGVLYGLTASGVTALQGAADGDEAEPDWYAETGELGLDAPEQKYLQRLELRLSPNSGAWVKAHVSYDEGRTWHYAGSLQGDGRRLRAGLLAVRPVRCPQLRLRLSGHGGCRIYSISAVYERGSDLP